MSAVEALKAARAAGIELALDGADLALSAASAPPAAVPAYTPPPAVEQAPAAPQIPVAPKAPVTTVVVPFP